MKRLFEPVWFAWDSTGGRHPVLTPWGREMLRTNEIPATLRGQFERELRYFSLSQEPPGAAPVQRAS